MKKKVFFIAICAMIITVGVIFVSKQNDKIGQIALLMQNVEALTHGETLPGKICYFSGKSNYEDRIPCTVAYPNIGKCGERVTAFYSTENAQCYE